MEGKRVEIRENIAGGKGFIKLEHLMSEKIADNCRMFASVTVKPGDSIGNHPHNGETETYYIISGDGIYTDNGKEYPVKVGDTVHCKDGDSHGIRNEGTADLVFIALILMTK